ncbi:MAG: hypothetical protein LBS19_13275 [Clostridiales bacterium]|jgi:hypothetical protein|nr:hypothetical protein [Clostridiales bacterium]
MIKLIAGEKGEGKTKRLIREANERVAATDGKIVFIDDDKRHIYDLHHKIRFVDTEDFPLANYRELVGFIYGILSQDSDIESMYIDGLSNLVKSIDNDSLLKLKSRLDNIEKTHGVNFFATLNCDPGQLPEELKAVVV